MVWHMWNVCLAPSVGLIRRSKRAVRFVCDVPRMFGPSVPFSFARVLARGEMGGRSAHVLIVFGKDGKEGRQRLRLDVAIGCRVSNVVLKRFYV